MKIEHLPLINASLNLASALFLISGYFFIRRKQILQHKTCMFMACVTSTAFLISYLTYHAFHGSQRFQGQGFLRALYFFILTTHTLLAVVIVPLAVVTFWRALKQNFEKHAKIARVTFPLWVYVSITGVIIYWMLYRM